MGRKQNNKQWEGQQWHDYNAHGKWQLWPGSRHARQQASQQELRYDAMEVSTSQTQAKEDADPTDVGSVASQRNRAIQQALTKAKKADGRARKLKEERERREAQWKAFAKSMQARYVRNREQYEADLLRLDEELQATKRQGAEAADLVTAIVTGQIPEAQDAGMEQDTEWENLIAENDRAPEGYLQAALQAAARGAPRAGGPARASQALGTVTAGPPGPPGYPSVPPGFLGFPGWAMVAPPSTMSQQEFQTMTQSPLALAAMLAWRRQQAQERASSPIMRRLPMRRHTKRPRHILLEWLHRRRTRQLRPPPTSGRCRVRDSQSRPTPGRRRLHRMVLVLVRSWRSDAKQFWRVEPDPTCRPGRRRPPCFRRVIFEVSPPWPFCLEADRGYLWSPLRLGVQRLMQLPPVSPSWQLHLGLTKIKPRVTVPRTGLSNGEGLTVADFPPGAVQASGFGRCFAELSAFLPSSSASASCLAPSSSAILAAPWALEWLVICPRLGSFLSLPCLWSPSSALERQCMSSGQLCHFSPLLSLVSVRGTRGSFAMISCALSGCLPGSGLGAYDWARNTCIGRSGAWASHSALQPERKGLPSPLGPLLGSSQVYVRQASSRGRLPEAHSFLPVAFTDHVHLGSSLATLVGASLLAFGRSLALLLLFALLLCLFRQRGPLRKRERSALVESGMGLVSVLGSLGCQHPCVPAPPACTRHGRHSRRLCAVPPLPLRCRVWTAVLTFFGVPTQVWAAPKHVHLLRSMEEHYAAARPEALPAASSAWPCLSASEGSPASFVARGLGMQFLAPHFQTVYATIFDVATDSVAAALDQAAAIASEAIHMDMVQVAPACPQLFRGYATVVAYPSCLESAGVAVAVLDLLQVGANRFACVLPEQAEYAELLAYIMSLSSIREDTCEIFVGDSTSPHGHEEPIWVRPGLVITAVPVGCRPQPGDAFDSLLASPAVWGDPAQYPRPLLTPGVCILFNEHRFFVNKRHQPGQTPHAVAAQSAGVEEADSFLCMAKRPDLTDVAMNGNDCKGVVALIQANPPLPCPPARERRNDNVCFLDLRPCGFKPQHHYQIGCERHMPSLLRQFLGAPPPGYTYVVEGGSQAGEVVTCQSGDTLVVRALSERDILRLDASSESGSDSEDSDAGSRSSDHDPGSPGPSGRSGSRDHSPASSRSRTPRRPGREGFALSSDELAGPLTCVAPPAQWEGRPSRLVALSLFRVMCPMHQDEIITLQLCFPAQVAEVLAMVRNQLSRLKPFSLRSLVPAFPQPVPDAAVVVLGGEWHELLGLVVVIMDFSGLDGPLYAKYTCMLGAYSDLTQEASRHHFVDWDAYLFGSSERHPPGHSFRAVHGGVVQFCQPDRPPSFQGTLSCMLRGPLPCGRCSGVQEELQTTLLLAPDGRTIAADSHAQDMQEVAASLVGDPSRQAFLFAPHDGCLQDFSHHGSACQRVLAVFDSPLGADGMDGALVFLDARQAGGQLAYVWLRTSEASLGYLARFAGICTVPPGFYLSVEAATPSARPNHIRLQHMQTVVFGFLRESEDADGLSDSMPQPRSLPVSAIMPFAEDTLCLSLPFAGDETSNCVARYKDGILPFARPSGGSSLVPPALDFAALLRMCMWFRRFFSHDAFPIGSFLSTPAFPRFGHALEPPIWFFRVPSSSSGAYGPPAVLDWDVRHDEHEFLPDEQEFHLPFLARRPADEDAEPASEGGESEAGPPVAVFVVLAPQCLPEQVLVPLEPGLGMQDFLDIVNDERLESLFRLYPVLWPARPQPDSSFGVLLASPAWAAAFHFACFDVRDLDGRLFVTEVPVVATRAQLCALADVPDTAAVSVFAYGSLAPLGHDELAPYAAGGTVVFSVRNFLLRPLLQLEHMLESPFLWDSEPALPMGPVGDFYCCVSDQGNRLLAHDRVVTLAAAVARLYDATQDQVEQCLADPEIADVVMHGHHCQNVIAVQFREAWPAERPLPLIVDCRPLLRGFAVFPAPGGWVLLRDVESELDVFAPPGMQVRLSPLEVEGGYLRVADGLCIVAFFEPANIVIASPPRPWEGYDPGGGPGSSHEPGLDDTEAQPGLGSLLDSSSPEPRSRSPRGRSHQRQTSSGGSCMLASMALAAFVWTVTTLMGQANGRSFLLAVLLQRMAQTPLFGRPFYLYGACFLMLAQASAMQLDLYHVRGPECHLQDASLGRPRVLWPLATVSSEHPSCCEAGGGTRPLSTPCRAFPSLEPDFFLPLRTLLEESVAQPGSRAFLWAATLLDELTAHFGGSSPSVTPGQPVTLSLESMLAASDVDEVPSAVQRPEVFDMDSQQCLLPGSQAVFDSVFRRVAFAQLPAAPVGLPQADRFARWLSRGNVGRSPGPAEILILTSDGSFVQQTASAGWGVTFSLWSPSLNKPAFPGQFVGCIFGPMTAFLGALSEGALGPDAYDAEIAGLFWSALAAVQLHLACPVLIRADNDAALRGRFEAPRCVQPLAVCMLAWEYFCLGGSSMRMCMAMQAK